MEINSCRDCANFEDRRCKEGIALCAMHHGPSLSCPEFRLKNGKKFRQDSNDMFCLNCANYENVGGIPICARDHRPGVACAAFKARSVEPTIII